MICFRCGGSGKITKQQKCIRCGGRGDYPMKDPYGGGAFFKCYSCDGLGYTEFKEKCPSCNGTGESGGKKSLF